MWNNETEQALSAVRAMLMDELGIQQVDLDTSRIPNDLLDLTQLAMQFGIGDDGAREMAIDMMPAAFVAEASKRVRNKAERISEWAEDGPFTDEKSAFVALLQAFLYRERPQSREIDPERQRAFEDALNRFTKR